MVSIVAVVGVCAQERRGYARRLAAANRWPVVEALRSVPAGRLAETLATAIGNGPQCEAAVFDAAGRWDAVELIGALAGDEADGHGAAGGARLAQLVAVVDVAHFFDDLADDDGAEEGASTAAERLVHGIEFASTVVLVNWEPLPTPDLSTLMALVNHLAPRARLRLDQPAANLELELGSVGREQDGAGWMRLINRDFVPYMTDSRVSGFVYEQMRPFHAGRLAEALDGDIGHGRFGRLVRSAGFCSLASRPGILAQWEQVGGVIGLEPLPATGDGGMLAIGQELAVVGLDLDRDGLTSALDACALTDRELAEGPLAWMAYPDPLPRWASGARAEHG
ncbi:GTP-binding protein [Sinomonas sp. JGH33]|uniref:GTP-binding protein n=1 Tax=Sinomonas terricola TaxID=3110330 RepID=A0ABU5T9X0_9MICC|nr:GTP-binding protein [Sinomonas sp. JGH33]MEA5456383.1 GTP-binding protein [Sinomonas sp. JGH33]